MFQELFHYVERSSPIHRLDPRTKILLLIPILMIAIITANPYLLSVLLVCVVFIFLLTRIPFKRFKALLKIALISGLLLIPSQTLFFYGFYLRDHPVDGFWIITPETAESIPVLGDFILWVTYGQGIIASLQGFVFGLIIALKMITMMVAGSLLLMTTKPKDIILTFNKMGVPFKITFTAITALRFLPLVMEEWTSITNAQKARGSKFRKAGIRNFIKTLNRSFATLIYNSVRRAKVLALAMETRAFGANKKRTSLTDLQMTRTDRGLTIVFCAVIASIVVLAVIFPKLFL